MAGIDALLLSQGRGEAGPGKPTPQDNEELKHQLEERLLSPSKDFSIEWLNRLQQRWDFEADYTSLFKLAPPQTRTLTRFLRHGLEGRVTGYKNVTVTANSATADRKSVVLCQYV